MLCKKCGTIETKNLGGECDKCHPEWMKNISCEDCCGHKPIKEAFCPYCGYEPTKEEKRKWLKLLL